MTLLGASRAIALGLACLALIVPLASAHAETQIRPAGRSNYTGFTLTTASAFPFVFAEEMFSGEGIGTAVGNPPPDAERVDIRLRDLTGEAVAAWVYFLKPGVDDTYTTKLICSRTPKALAINPEYAVLVGTAVGQCGGNASLPTRGTVSFRFSS